MNLANFALAWQKFDFQTAGIVFLAYLLVDGMYAYYTIAVTKLKPFSSASVGALMHFLIAFGVLNYVQNYLYVLPLAAGSWAGTYFAVKREQGKAAQSASENVLRA